MVWPVLSGNKADQRPVRGYSLADTSRRDLYLVYALSMILMTAYAAIFTLLAEIRNTFGFNDLSIGLIAGSAFVAGFIAQLSLSGLADRGYGKHLLILGLVLSIAAISWMIVASDLLSWVLSRSLLGFGAGCTRPGLRRYILIVDPSLAGKRLGSLAAWEMVGFLIGPILSSIMFSFAGIDAPFFAILTSLLIILPMTSRLEIPAADRPVAKAIRTLLRTKAMQSCLAIGVAFYLAIGVFEAVWAIFMSDLGASQLFIGVTMSLFTVPMIIVAPLAGNIAQKTNTLRLITLTMSAAILCMISYGALDSIWWLCVPLIFHSIADAVTMPAIQLAVGVASGKGALAAGQGLFGALGLLVAAVASLAGSYIYQISGPFLLWLSSGLMMALFVGLAIFLGKGHDWHYEIND